MTTLTNRGAVWLVLAAPLSTAVFIVVGPADAGPATGELARQAPGLNPEIVRLALSAVRCAQAKGFDGKGVLTIIDYSLPSIIQRLWVFDLDENKLLFHELVAHGKNTGENLATEFSNDHGSKQSSLGLFLTAGTYQGRNGYSLKLHGLEEGVNHRALDRTIVLHGAWYVSEDFADRYGRLGRSWGCPAVRKDVARLLIDAIKDGTYLFIYYPDDEWLGASEFLHGCGEDSMRSPAGPTGWEKAHDGNRAPQ